MTFTVRELVFVRARCYVMRASVHTILASHPRRTPPSLWLRLGSAYKGIFISSPLRNDLDTPIFAFLSSP